jgi:3-hydroxyisobutyrate dehydrogenase
VTSISRVPLWQDVYLKTSDSIIPALKRLPKGELTLCIDSTTLDVDVAREVAKNVADAGAAMIDAPVSGGITSFTQS